jgi:hypothetical protein
MGLLGDIKEEMKKIYRKRELLERYVAYQYGLKEEEERKVRREAREETPGTPISLEKLGRIFGALAILLYIIGLLTVNTYLFSLGVSEFSLLRARFIYTGALTTVFGVFCFGFPIFFLCLIFSEFPKRGEARGLGRLLWFLGKVTINLTAALVSMAVPGFLFFLFLKVTGAQNFASGIFNFYFVIFTLGLMIYLIVTFLRMIEKPSDWLLLSGVGGIALGLFFWYLVLFTNHVYPAIPEQYGGGKPAVVRFLFATESIKGLRQLGIPIAEKSELSPPMRMVFDGTNFCVVPLSNGALVKLDKKLVRGMVFTK